MHTRLSCLALAGLLGTLVACGGSKHAADPASPSVAPAVPASGLAYTDPTSTGWRLVKDPTSTPTRLVLNLVGPSGLRSRGIGFNLKAPETVAFGTFEGDVFAKDAGVFDLLNRHRGGYWDMPTNPEPVFFASGVKPGNLLTVGLFQKDRMLDAKVVSRPLLQVALCFDPVRSKSLEAGDVLRLDVTKAKHIPEDIGRINPDGSSDFNEIQAKSRLDSVSIAVGVLTAK